MGVHSQHGLQHADSVLNSACILPEDGQSPMFVVHLPLQLLLLIGIDQLSTVDKQCQPNQRDLENTKVIFLWCTYKSYFYYVQQSFVLWK